MTSAYDHDYFHGKLLDVATIMALKAMEADLGYELTITQGIGGAPASGGTHLRGRAVDLAPYDWKNKLRVGLKHGLIGWHRPYIRGLWPEHNHLVLVLGDIDNQRGIAPAAWRQIIAYVKRRSDGLRSDRFDSSTRPDLLVPFVYPPKEPVVPPFSNHITKARDLGTEVAHQLGLLATELEQAAPNRPTKAGKARINTAAVTTRTLRRGVILLVNGLPPR